MIITKNLSSLMIRESIIEDSSSIAELMTQLGYPSTTQEMESRFLRISKLSDYHSFVAELHGQVVGFAGACISHAFEKNSTYLRLIALIVDEKFRGNGIGNALVEEVEKWAKAAGVSSVVITSGAAREKAHEFYKRAGYPITGVRMAKNI